MFRELTPPLKQETQTIWKTAGERIISATLKSLFYTPSDATFSGSSPSTFFFLEELHDSVCISNLSLSVDLSEFPLHCLNGKSGFETQFVNFGSFSLP
jgi:hypothetical protein